MDFQPYLLEPENMVEEIKWRKAEVATVLAVQEEMAGGDDTELGLLRANSKWWSPQMPTEIELFCCIEFSGWAVFVGCCRQHQPRESPGVRRQVSLHESFTSHLDRRALDTWIAFSR